MGESTKLLIMSVLMVVTGSLNTVLLKLADIFFSRHLDVLHQVFVKLADMQTAENSAGETEGSGVFFNHPFLQVQSHLLFLSGTFDSRATSIFLRGMLFIIIFI